MTWWVATISRHHPGNWGLCKEVGYFGYTRGRAGCEPGDHLLVWVGGRGYIGFGLVTGPPRAPASRAEAPWAGGTRRFTSVVPFRMQLELDTGGIYLPFRKNIQDVTGINTARLQHGLSCISDKAATRVTMMLLERELGSPFQDDGVEDAKT